MARQTIRIDDLRNPVLERRQRSLLDAADRDPVELTVDSVLASARERADLSDFGPDDFVERLALWVAEVDADDNRTGYSRRRMHTDCVRFAANRLRVVELLAQHPEIREIDVRAPVVVVGMPRTGTTHLVNVLAADERFRSLRLWESREPIPVPGEVTGPDGIDPRYRRAAEAWEAMKLVNPAGAAMHAMHPDHVHEELELECIDFSSYRMEWSMQMLPRWRDYYLSHDQTPHYEFVKTMLQILQWQRGPDRWVLKCPQHLEQLGPLMTTFPDATVVLTHRDPVAVVQSAVTMLSNNARMSFRRPDIDAIFEYWVDRIERLLASGERDLHLIPDAQRVDVLFADLLADQIGTIEELYGRMALDLPPDARARIERHIADNPRGQVGNVAYDLRGDFNVDPGAVRRRFRNYVARSGVPLEVQ